MYRQLLLLGFLMTNCVWGNPVSMLQESPIENGLVVHLGCGNGGRTGQLTLNGRFFVHALDTDIRHVYQAKQNIGAQSRIFVDQYDGKHLPYADNLINVVIVEDAAQVPRQEIIRVLRPLGWAYIKQGQQWQKVVKPWPEGMAQWTHYHHGPDNNAVAMDDSIGPPRHIRWLSDPIWSRHHDVNPSITNMVSSDGRLYYINDETPIGFGPGVTDQWVLIAQDAFNGMPLWKRPVPNWGWKAWASYQGGYAERFNHPQLAKRLVAFDDRVYVTLGYNAPVSILEGATGRLLQTLPDSKYTDEIMVEAENIFVSIKLRDQVPAGQSPSLKRKQVAAYNRLSGERLWTSRVYAGIETKKNLLGNTTHLFMALGDKGLFLIHENMLVALDKRTGHELWQAALPCNDTMPIHYGYNSRGMCKILASADAAVVCQLDTEPGNDKIKDFKQPWNRPIKTRVRVYDAGSGDILWTVDAGNWGHYSLPELFVLNNRLRIHHRSEKRLLTVDLATGQILQSRTTQDAFDNKHHHRCYENRATSRYLISSFRGLEYMPWDSNETDHNHWLRGTCQLGIFPCNGLTYATPHPCDCYLTSKFNGLGAFAAKTTAHPISAPLTQGPAYGRVPKTSLVNEPTDWPMYRCDTGRSSYTPIPLEASLEHGWTTDCNDSGLTAPVIAQGRVLLGSMETGTVYCLDLHSGQILWHFITSGPIDSPPTIANHLAVVGSHDGSVYCLDVATGTLVWRFRCSAMHRCISAFGRIESAWPVHGSVLVQNHTVYAAAGRSSYIDNGFNLYELKLQTGDVLAEKHIQSPAGQKTDWGRSPDVDYGLRSDILVAQDDHIFMRQRSVFGRAYTGPVWGGHLTSWSGLLDDSWFNRSVWLLDGIPYGEILTYSDQMVFGIRAYDKRGPQSMFEPGQKGYLLFGAKRKPLPVNKKGWISNVSTHPKNNLWEHRVDIRITGFVLTDRVLFSAGTPDRIDRDPANQWATYKGQKEGLLVAFATDTGKRLTEIPLDSGPVYDGMAASDGRLVISLKNGRVLCYTSQ